MGAQPAISPLVLVIRDGWGLNPNREHDSFNAIHLAHTPVDDALMREWPHTLIRTSGEDVGLPLGSMGNSEVGHQNIGAGRIVDQDSVRITKAIRDGSFFSNAALAGAVDRAAERGGTVHLMGLVSDAGVHALLEHLRACLTLCARRGAERVAIHAFTDGRDTGPFTGAGFLDRVEAWTREEGVGRIASVMGRYFAMDRDNRWERVRRAYDCLTGRGERAPRFATAGEAIRDFYDNPTDGSRRGDEFVTPRTVGGSDAEVDGTRVRDGDTVIFVNFRGDRPREICRAFLMERFEGGVAPSPDSGARGFDRGARLDLAFVCMTAYSEDVASMASVAFPKPPRMTGIMGEWISGQGLTQFRCAETEKFPHVTFFFNDYRDEPFEGERREIIQSPRVSTYDLQPEMSAAGVRDAVLARLGAPDCEPFIVVNFANPDMVGHTGRLDAAVRACETVDACVGAIVEATLARGGALIVTADHGNAEQMWDPEHDSPHTAHTTYDVPLLVIGESLRGVRLREGGRLADIAPTALRIMGLRAPAEMTGRSLIP